jgi:hypothetical protein
MTTSTIPSGFEQSAPVNFEGETYVARRAIGSDDFWVALDGSDFDSLTHPVEIEDSEFVF